MSKSGGGGGLKSHDKGGSGSCKVIKKDQGLEAALDKVPDAIMCPANHRMKLHFGTRREGPLTCDGPDDRCCGRDGDGILHVGEERYSCVECDFDICPPCMEYETGEELTPEQEKEKLRQRLREKAGRGGGGGGQSAAAKAKAEADAKAAAIAAKRAEIEKAVADAKAKAAVMALTAPAEGGAGPAEPAKQPAETDEAKEAKKRAAAAKKKEKQKAKKAQAQAQAQEEAPTEQRAEAEAEDAPPASPPTAAAFAFKPASEAAATAPAPQKAFTFDWNLSTPPAKGAAADDDDDDDSSDADSDAGEGPEVVPADGGAAGQLAAEALDADGLLRPPENPLVCAFTQQLMEDPVILADGHTYERKAAEAYLAKFDRSPRTGEKLAHKSVLPNLLAREMCMCAKQLEM